MKRVSIAALGLVVVLAGGLPAKADFEFNLPGVKNPLQTGVSGEMAKTIANLEKALEKGDREDAAQEVASIARLMYRQVANMSDKDFEAALAARAKAAEAGVDLGDWKSVWNYDDLDLNDKQKKFVEVAERELDRGYNAGATSPSDGERQQAIEKASAVLGREDFKTDKILAHYRDQVGGPKLAGILHVLNLHRFERLVQIYSAVLTNADDKEPESTAASLGEARDLYKAIGLSGQSWDAATLKANPADELDDKTVTLKQAMVKFEEIGKKNAKLLAIQKKKEAELAKKWATLLKADKAKLAAKLGRPEYFELTMDGWQPEDAAKSSWWAYFEQISPSYWWRTRYEFNAAQKLTNTEKTIVYIPVR